MRKWSFYTTKEIKPEGWLRRQLEIQAEGLSGNLDKVWRDVRDSAWIGGEAEGWERVPYWLDGFIPLAYLLENEDMIARARKYIDAILSYQRPDGWICPCKEEEIPQYDTWAVQLLSKVLVVYYECAGDERIPPVLYKVLKNYYTLLQSGRVQLFTWGKHRWFEAFIAIDFVYRRCGEGWLLSLARLLREQGVDYTALTHRWHRPLNEWKLDTHVVNLAMMLKYEALSADLLGEAYTDEAERLLSVLLAYNGTPVGLFTGDECLSGLSPIQGTELCAVAEQMYSYEWLLAYTGEGKWAERLEKLAFNALPATLSDDMWAHQYLQMSNQISCQSFPGRSLFRTNNSEAHLFGLEPNYGCCTANFNQAWPKLALSAFMHRKGEVFSALPVPSVLESEAVSVRLETEYPFENSFRYTVSAREDTTLIIRIPSFAQGLCVNGKPTPKSEALSFFFAKGEGGTISLSFEVAPTVTPRPHSLVSVEMGSLVFSLPIAYEKRAKEYERNGVLRRAPYCDYEYIPKSPWSYALASPLLEVERRGVGAVPFGSDSPPVVLRARLVPIAWGLEDGFDTVCAKVPESRLPLGEAEALALYPYGCAKLRITELPLV